MGKKKKKKKTELTIHSKETRTLLGLVVLLIGLAVLAAPFLEGEGFVFTIITDLLGVTSIMWGVLLIILSGRIMTKNNYLNSNQTLLGALLLALVSNVLFSFWITDQQIAIGDSDYSDFGGALGYFFHSALVGFMGKFIEFIFLMILATISFSLLSGISMERITNRFIAFIEGIFKRGQGTVKIAGDVVDDGIKIVDSITGGANDEDLEKSYVGDITQISDNQITDSTETENTVVEPKDEEISYIESQVEKEKAEKQKATTNGDSPDNKDDTTIPEPLYPNWTVPPIELLKQPMVNTPDKEIHKRNSIIIEKTLRSFSIESKISKITIGPTVVQYALSITVGTKVSKIRNLLNDIALALATPESQIRIEAPIPGTSLIGIEIPNPEPNFVFVREMIESLRAEIDNYELPLLLGKDISGKCVIQDLAKLPHLLVAGATGTGKSVGINTILTGLLMTKSPDELKLVLVDPKMVEMAPYNGIAHLLTPVITDMELVVNALQWTVEEMLRRYRILKQVGTRNIAEFNNKSAEANMPYIVVVIDEMADLMLSAGVDVESKIVRLAQMARAVGIHLILATQRPSVDVITGLIKANVPGRVAFSVSTSIDSRVILDQTGAEALIGKGDMMFKSPAIGRPLRLQGAWTDTPDTEAIIEFIKDQAKKVDYSEEIIKPRVDTSSIGSSKPNVNGGLSEDELFKDALAIVIGDQKASASMLQRRLRIGYNRAARLIDELQAAGAIEPQDGSKPRKVLVSSVEQILGEGESTDENDF